MRGGLPSGFISLMSSGFPKGAAALNSVFLSCPYLHVALEWHSRACVSEAPEEGCLKNQAPGGFKARSASGERGQFSSAWSVSEVQLAGADRGRTDLFRS